MEDWKEFYPDAAEAHLRKKLEQMGGPINVQVYVDTNHTGKLEKKRFQLGILIYVNNKLINFYSKRYNTD